MIVVSGQFYCIDPEIYRITLLAPVVQRVDRTFLCINLYPVGNSINFHSICAVNSAIVPLNNFTFALIYMFFTKWNWIYDWVKLPIQENDSAENVPVVWDIYGSYVMTTTTTVTRISQICMYNDGQTIYFRTLCMPSMRVTHFNILHLFGIFW